MIKRLFFLSLFSLVKLKALLVTKKSHRTPNVMRVSVLLAIYWCLCVYICCVCACAPEPLLMMASSQLCGSFSSQRIYSCAINDCSHFAFLLLLANYCSWIPDALEVRAGHQHFPWGGFTYSIALVHRVSFYPSLSCSLGPDWAILIHALWTLLILYIVKWKQEKHSCFTWHRDWTVAHP